MGSALAGRGRSRRWWQSGDGMKWVAGCASSPRPPGRAITLPPGGKLGLEEAVLSRVPPSGSVIGLCQVEEMTLRLPWWGTEHSGAGRLSAPGSR